MDHPTYVQISNNGNLAYSSDFAESPKDTSLSSSMVSNLDGVLFTACLDIFLYFILDLTEHSPPRLYLKPGEPICD